MKTAPFVLRKGSVPKKYDHISFVPPKGVRDEAKRGLKLRREHGRGGLSTKQASSHGIGSGVQRAATLASGGRVSPSTIKRMRSFFARHSAYKEHHKDRTSAAYISWLLWGGDAGERWANKVYAQMERADEEMKKAGAGGERAGHKYIRRIRTMSNGRMGYRYIYKKPQRQATGQGDQDTTNERTSTGALKPEVFSEAGLDHIIRETSPSKLEDTDDAFAVQFNDGSYALLEADGILEALESPDGGNDLFAVALLEWELGDLATDWEPADAAQSMFDSEVDHSDTFEAIDEAPMGDMNELGFLVEGEDSFASDATSVDEEDEDTSVDAPSVDATSVDEDEGPSLDDAAEQHATLTETLRENPQLEPLADAIDAIAPVKDGKINLPVKEVGKAIALITLIVGVETYKTATVDQDNPVKLDDLETVSRRELKQMDKDKIAEAKAKMRESLNKERQEARDKMTREKLAARLKERQEKNKAREQRERKKKEEADAKEKARSEEREQRERDKERRHQEKLAAAEEAKTRELEFRREEAELKEKRKEEKAREREAAKKKKAEEAEAAKKKKAEEAEAAKRQKEKDAEDKKKLDTREARAQERREKKATRKKRATETPRKKRKEKREEAALENKEKRKLEKEKANKEKEKADKKKLAAFQERAASRSQKVPKRVPKRVRRTKR